MRNCSAACGTAIIGTPAGSPAVHGTNSAPAAVIRSATTGSLA
ncbi:hypothetical protein [Nocardia sp. NPDC002869]